MSARSVMTTLLVVMIACFVVAFVQAVRAEAGGPPASRPLLVIGFGGMAVCLIAMTAGLVLFRWEM